jgi:hypothetical protein
VKRRDFLMVPVAWLLAPLAGALGAPVARRGTYAAEVGILYDMLSFRLRGTIEEAVDRPGGRYEVTIKGEGAGVANRIESSGMLRHGRWAPVRTRSWFDVRGRETRSDLAYDHGRGVVQFHSRSETFFLRRVRVVDDVVPVGQGAHVDDVVSAILNFAEGRWPAAEDGSYETLVVRRRRRSNEGADDVDQAYRGELLPVQLKVATDPESGRPVGTLDLGGFSSWARADRPGRVVFTRDRRPEVITVPLMLGTSVVIRLAGA